MSISVIIPTYNGGNLLDKCLYYLKPTLPGSSEIIVVDNASEDKTVIMLPLLERKGIQTIRNKANLGFAGAADKGAKKAKGTYLLFLNNDCFLKKDTISQMLSFMKKNPMIVATQPIVLDKAGKIENIGYQIDTRIGKAEVIVQKTRWSTVSRKDTDHIYGLSATCLFIRKDVFYEIGMFDETFHSYLEDVDLFLRLHKRGKRYFPTLHASCSHLHMATSKKLGSYKQWQDLKNWVRIIKKDYEADYIFQNFSSLFVERLKNVSGLLKSYVE